MKLLEPFRLLSNSQCQSIIDQASQQQLVTGSIYRKGLDLDVRSNRVFWLNLDQNLKNYLWDIALDFRYQIPWTWFQEPIQVSCYSVGQSYGWHNDVIPRGSSRRCLTLTCTLNTTDAAFCTRDQVYNLEAGWAVFFPSDLEHCALAPVQGYRWSLTVWYMKPLQL